MQSKITERDIIFWSCNRHVLHSKNKNTWIRNIQFHESESQSPDEEVLISIMGSISLDDVDQVEANPSKDWLGVEQEAQACSILISMDNVQLNGHDYIYQDNSDLLPFDPDFQDAEAQQIIF